jgi:hypothetical protein
MAPQTQADFTLEDFAVDLSDVKDVPDGEYTLNIVELRPFKSQPSEKNPQGLRMVNAKFTITDPGEVQGRSFWQKLAIETSAAFLFSQLLQVLSLSDGSEEKVNVRGADLLNKSVRAYINTKDNEQYGKQVNIVRFLQ